MVNTPNSGPSCTNAEIKDFNSALDKIVQDRKIDGVDLQEINALYNMYVIDKKECITGTKKELQNIFSETLKNGYIIKNKNDIVVLEKMLKIIGVDYKLEANYEKLYQYGNFSVKFNNGVLDFFSGENATNISLKRTGIITPEGKYERMGILQGLFSTTNNLDVISDDNNISADLTKLKVKEMPEIVDGTDAPLPPSTDGGKKIEDDCQVCATGPKAQLDIKRQIVKGIDADEKYRKDVSQRWMNTKNWKELVQDYNSNKSKLPPKSEVVVEMEKVLNGTFSPQDIQNLQHCLGMLDKGQAQDSKESQDGMLGKNTTEALKKWIHKECAKIEK